MPHTSAQNAIEAGARTGPSAARSALAAHLAAIRAADDEVAKLLEPLRRLNAAAAGKREAEEALARIAAAEADDIAKWAKTGRGAMPQPRVADRRAAADRLAAANATADAAHAASGDVDHRLQDANHRLATLRAQTPGLVREALLESATPFAAELDAQLTAARRALRILFALRGHLMDAQSPDDPATFGHLQRVPLPGLDQTLRDLALGDVPAINRSVANWKALAQRLATDPAAQLEE